ncbi:MAG: InlB B-repeat-containing protein [Paludibacteraceae bacterium]|nr:InlB B-repeat-containing protein [Paludibacteraceae bacterium]
MFRIYPINKPFKTCPNSFFFAWDKQDYVKYRKTNALPPSAVYTTERKIYTADHLEPMTAQADPRYFETDEMQIPVTDSAYFYVGRNNKYHNPSEPMPFGSGGSKSQFKNIKTLRVRPLAGADAGGVDSLFTAKGGAYGKMVIDTTASADNLGVMFEPKGYFLRTNSGLNVEMLRGIDENDRVYWQTANAWTITSELAAYTIKATLYTGPTFSASDKGADIRGWSTLVGMGSIPLLGGGAITTGMTGYARIYPDNSSANGGMVFVTADNTKYIRYHKNGHFGEDIPDQYPAGGTVVTVQRAHLLTGYTFTGWNTAADGSGTSYAPGDEVDLSSDANVTIEGGNRVLHLYAQATYTGSVNVAISFLKDGERYFLTQPGVAPRYSRARKIDDWTSAWQGMGDVNNNTPGYISTFEIIGKPTCIECRPDEYVLDPRRHAMYGNTDSLVFYENFQPENNEYLGLYYDEPYTVIANNTWAGLFQSSMGWPTPAQPCIEATRLSSSHYLHNLEAGIGNFDRDRRGGAEADTVIRYNAAAGQFDACALADSTSFMLSGVGVVDNHYVILPGAEDASSAWVDEITFGYRENQTENKQVWSRLIGKHLLAQMTIGNEIVYFHPEPSQTVNTANGLQMTLGYRLSQTFTLIPDARPHADTVSAAFRPTLESASNDFSRIVASGSVSPIDVKDDAAPSHYIDLCDTLRIRLVPAVSSMIADYYGRWKTGAEGLHVANDGSRYRDILIHTKTYHYSGKDSLLLLTPASENYNFSPLANQSQQLNFKLEKVVYHWLLDKDGNRIRKEGVDTTDVTADHLRLVSSNCTFASTSDASSDYFSVSSASNDQITLATVANNADPGNNVDTLIVTIPTVTIEGATYSVSTRVPLQQGPLEGSELVWSVEAGGTRYFILAGSGGLIFRDYNYVAKDKKLYKKGTTSELKIGSKNAANDDTQYLTPWKYSYAEPDGMENQQLTLKTEYYVNKYLVISGDNPALANSDPSTFTYRYAGVNVNDNANFEELVRIKYGSNQWLKFSVTDGVPSLSLQTGDSANATVFSWGYLQKEYYLHEKNSYPSVSSLEFGSNRIAKTIQTRYKAYSIYSMLLNNTLTYLGKVNQETLSNLIDPSKEWKTAYTDTITPDRRVFDAPASSGLTITDISNDLITTITPVGASPTEVKIGGKFVDIVDTLDFTLKLQPGAPAYRFTSKWSSYKSVADAHLKIPLICKTYHVDPYDSLVCNVAGDEHDYMFPPTLVTAEDSTHTFTLSLDRHTGSFTRDVDNNLISTSANDPEDVTSEMNLASVALAEMRMIDDAGNTPSWCHISGKTANTLTVRCTENGIRAPRRAYIYLAFAVYINSEMRFVNFRLSVTQPSYFTYKNNQHLVHTNGYSGDPLVDGVQQVHENKRILYYYPEQNVELPIRERGFYGWWRWYREGNDENGIDVGDTDVPDSLWRTRPVNVKAGGAYDIPYRTIGDSVWVDENDHSKGKILVTMGRYTVFHYPAKDYTKNNPPANSPSVVPPINKQTLTYVADLSNYYDNLPLSTKPGEKNQIDRAKLDTTLAIYEPTLSLREIFELHPWTEMAATMENYKDTIASGYRNQRYMEDHEVYAPIGHPLLLRTEQRYDYNHVKKQKHSESLLGYYMRDDHWSDGGWSDERKDTMIWCGGWDAECKWYTYNPSTKVYTACAYPTTESDDFLQVPARLGITAGKEADTVYYCLRSRSKSTTTAGTPGSPDPAKPADGAYWFNICRYMIIYHDTLSYGPMQERIVDGADKAIITNDEIERTYEVLERLDFDENKPGEEYTVYPHPLPWADASYGYSYPMGPAIPDNRYHNAFAPNFPGSGEYSLINRMVPKLPGKDYYWYEQMEQHGGATNGYMIYCDGMASAGQVAALNLSAKLCEGQKMYFSGYVGNPSNQTGKSNPNFYFSVQGSMDGSSWEDITSYTTGDILPSTSWYQIFFPINQKRNYEHFRVRIYNMASNIDGNDFILDDMCVFATKPPLVAYQANSTCMETGENDSITHVVLRVDYQGFTDVSYRGKELYYTVQKAKNGDTTYVGLVDHYINEHTETLSPSKPIDIYGTVQMPAPSYVSENPDSVFSNLNELISKFEDTDYAFKQGYIVENVDGFDRPVMYIIHKAKMTPDNNYKVRMALSYDDMRSSICAMTSDLKISNRMTLELNGEERENMANANLCANTTYDISLRVKGTLFSDGHAPMEVSGTCKNDWLMYGGDTTDVASVARFGYKYSDIVTVIKDILRCESTSGTNNNQFAANLAAVNHNKMLNIQRDKDVKINGTSEPTPDSEYDPYVILKHLVDNNFLVMYETMMTTTIESGDSVEYVVFPIVGSGSDEVKNANVEVCPRPLYVKLKAKEGQGVPLKIGGMVRDEAMSHMPIVVLADSITAATTGVTIRIDTIMPTRALKSVVLMSTDDPNFREGVHTVDLEPDRVYNLASGSDNSGYYKTGDNLVLRPAAGNNYRMRPGYSYTYDIVMQTRTGALDDGGCQVGNVPFTVSIVPNQLRWDPPTIGSNKWNDPNNWIGINQQNEFIHEKARFAPLSSTSVVIPTLTDGRLYPNLEDPEGMSSEDSIKQVGFQYNQCKDIRFMSGAAIGQQRLLDYDNVIVDMSTPQDKWALRATPVKGFFSGDIFMSNADLNWETSPWEVGGFDANGRNSTTGNASFWLSLYSRATVRHGNGDQVADTARSAAADWTRVTNGLTLSLPPSQGWAVYTHTKSGKDAAIRLPKSDDRYYYFSVNGQKMDELFEPVERGAGAGKLAYTESDFILTNAESSTLFVFGNPTMGFIDIWGFIHDNSLVEEIDYIDSEGHYTTLTKAVAEKTSNELSNVKRYLPPMHAMVVKVAAAATSQDVTLNTNRVVTALSQVVRPLAAPSRNAAGRSKGIMTVTAVNPVSEICTSRLLLGQGYNDAIRDGEDAVLTTINVDQFSTSTPATPFNIYAAEGGYGLSIDLRDEIVNVPVSFYLSELPYSPVTRLWFTGVNAIDGQLVLYDALTGSERAILDGIYIDIPTPEYSHQVRYYIRRRGYNPSDPNNPTTIIEQPDTDEVPAVKIIRDGHVLILRDGHVYTMFGQKLR